MKTNRIIARKYVTLLMVALCLIGAVLFAAFVHRAPAMDYYSVDWGTKAGTLNVTVFYSDGDIDAKTLTIEEAKQRYAHNTVISREIKDVLETERTVVCWIRPNELRIGIGDNDEDILLQDAVAKYGDNPTVLEKIRDLLAVRIEHENQVPRSNPSRSDATSTCGIGIKRGTPSA